METEGHISADGAKVKYGELIVLGYNGMHTLSNDKSHRTVSRFSLWRKLESNGVTRGRVQVVKAPKHCQSVLNTQQHSISYTLNKTKAVVVEYNADPNTDMFQIGRSSEPQIDFTVVDTWLGVAKDADEVHQSKLQSTISRYACRILVDRDSSCTGRLFAAGFDSSRNIFLGEKATKWTTGVGEIDGLTTNGVLILHPSQDECDDNRLTSYVWREVSVGGDIYSLRETRSASQRGELIDDENNTLTDGTLIDLCGATLLWRSALGLAETPTKRQLESRLDEINAGRPQCPVNLNTLVIPRGRVPKILPSNPASPPDWIPYVYFGCGHVQGQHNWGHKDEGQKHECPLCYTESDLIVQLSMGMETTFHLDSEKPTHAFKPCGHMASQRTVKYWSRIPLPQGSSSFSPVCPFCTVPLDSDKPYARLIFQDNCDS